MWSVANAWHDYELRRDEELMDQAEIRRKLLAARGEIDSVLAEIGEDAGVVSPGVVISEGAKATNLYVAQPSGSHVAKLRYVWTTQNGSWDSNSDPFSVPVWARQFLTKEFDDAGGSTHLFGCLLDRNGQVMKRTRFKFWTPEYKGNDVLVSAKEHSGWANQFIAESSAYDPATQHGPWAWGPADVDADVLIGGGLPGRQHVSMFGVWQM